jgi:hypothetical protein
MTPVADLREALATYDATGAFTEVHYQALKRALGDVGRVDPGLLDGFLGLFFERHVLDDARRRELLALDDAGLERAARHRFHQVVSDGHDAHRAWHTLSARVRDALKGLSGPGQAPFPASLELGAGFSSLLVEQALGALWAEWGRAPAVREATAELFGRYLQHRRGEEVSQVTRDMPAVLVARLDAQRLARGILDILSDDERELLRHTLDGGGAEAWAQARGVSRATAYRLLARVKSLCRVGFDDRSKHTQLEVLDALREHL